MLAFFLRSIVNPFKYILANFATAGLAGPQLFVLFWKVVSIFEQNGLKILTDTYDGTSPSRKFFKIHFFKENEEDIVSYVGVTCRMVNRQRSEKRFIYCISDFP